MRKNEFLDLTQQGTAPNRKRGLISTIALFHLKLQPKFTSVSFKIAC